MVNDLDLNNLTMGVEKRLDEIFSDDLQKNNAKIAKLKYVKSPSLASLRNIIMSLEREVTEDYLKDLLQELSRLQRAYIKNDQLQKLFRLVFHLGSMVFAKREHPEKWYQKQWCEAHEGQVEVTLPDGTRCDCLTDTHAIEFDFGDGWAEAIGQSAYYSLQTKKKPGIVLILETIKDKKYWIRINTTIEYFNLPIDTWKVGNTSY